MPPHPKPVQGGYMPSHQAPSTVMIDRVAPEQALPALNPQQHKAIREILMCLSRHT